MLQGNVNWQENQTPGRRSARMTSDGLEESDSGMSEDHENKDINKRQDILPEMQKLKAKKRANLLSAREKRKLRKLKHKIQAKVSFFLVIGNLGVYAGP